MVELQAERCVLPSAISLHGLISLLFVFFLRLMCPFLLCSDTLFPTYPVSIAYLCFIAAAYAHFVVSAINQICDFLHIRCFVIVPKIVAQ